MNNRKTNLFNWRSLSIGGAMMVAATLNAGATVEPQRNDDQETCARMGARYGSPSHTSCMLQQQQRKDNKMVLFLEEQRMHQELGRPAREKLEQKRERRAREKWREQGRN